MRTTKGEDQPAQKHSLISTFVGRCLDIITAFLAKSKISRLELVFVVERAGLSLTWSHSPGTAFLVIRLKYMYTIFFFLSFCRYCTLTMMAGVGLAHKLLKKHKKKITI